MEIFEKIDTPRQLFSPYQLVDSDLEEGGDGKNL